ncbi:hypothetical protein [Streptomyces sp. NPDC088348]|uniref:hypothetical protein n=1 Tax=Streptomyces sp. NPDC088348 TaxID=3365853 RepID=UPI003816E996
MSVVGSLSLGQLPDRHDILRDLLSTRQHEANNAALRALPHGVGREQARTALCAAVARQVAAAVEMPVSSVVLAAYVRSKESR